MYPSHNCPHPLLSPPLFPPPLLAPLQPTNHEHVPLPIVLLTAAQSPALLAWKQGDVEK